MAVNSRAGRNLKITNTTSMIMRRKLATRPQKAALSWLDSTGGFHLPILSIGTLDLKFSYRILASSNKNENLKGNPQTLARALAASDAHNFFVGRGLVCPLCRPAFFAGRFVSG